MCSALWSVWTNACSLFSLSLISEWFCVAVSLLWQSLFFLAEIWPRSFPNGPALSQCYCRGLATRLSRYQNHSHIGETSFSGCRWQLWPQTYQHNEVSLSPLHTGPMFCPVASAFLLECSKRFQCPLFPSCQHCSSFPSMLPVTSGTRFNPSISD